MNPEDLLWRPKRCMCLIWALVMYRRFHQAGYETYLTCRRSRFLRAPLMPHVLVGIGEDSGVRLWSYCPVQPEPQWVVFLFPGKVVEGDP